MVLELHAFDADRGRDDGDAPALRQVDLALYPRAVAQRCDGNPGALEVRGQIGYVARTFDATARESRHGRRHFTADQKDFRLGEPIAHPRPNFTREPLNGVHIRRMAVSADE